MNQPTMTLEIFKDHLETYGANFDRWPADALTLAKDLIHHSEEAKTALDAMRAFEAHLTASKESTPPADLLDKIIRKAHSD